MSLNLFHTFKGVFQKVLQWLNVTLHFSLLLPYSPPTNLPGLNMSHICTLRYDPRNVISHLDSPYFGNYDCAISTWVKSITYLSVLPNAQITQLKTKLVPEQNLKFIWIIMKITAAQKTTSRQLRITFAFKLAHFFQHFVYSINIRLVVINRDFSL